MNIAVHLQVVGALNLLLASLHFVFPRRFGWTNHHDRTLRQPSSPADCTDNESVRQTP